MEACRDQNRDGIHFMRHKISTNEKCLAESGPMQPAKQTRKKTRRADVFSEVFAFLFLKEAGGTKLEVVF